MADTTIDLLKNSSYVGKMDELIAAVKLGGSATSDVEWDNVKNKPTTIAGYGITDAKIENGTITLGNQTITPLTSAPVTSVNSKTGAVTLSATDVSAIPSTLTGTAGQVLTKTVDGQEWKDVDIPTALPNPNALTFTGAVTGTYDGSEALTVEIPSGGGEDELPIIQEYTIEGGETASIVFTGLPNISEFLLEIAWQWQSTAVSGTVRVSFSTTLSGYKHRVGRIPSVNTGINQKIIIRGRPITKNGNIVVLSAVAAVPRDENESLSVSEFTSTSVISVWWNDSGKYFPAGTTVSLRGK